MNDILLVNGVSIDKSMLMQYIQKNKKIQAIKYLKDHLNLGLKECKEIVDNLSDNSNYYPNNTILISTEIEAHEMHYDKFNPRSKKGSHFIGNQPSNTKNYIIVLLLAIICILIYFLSIK